MTPSPENPPTNQQLYELLQALDTRVEAMDGDHSEKFRMLTKRVNEHQEGSAK